MKHFEMSECRSLRTLCKDDFEYSYLMGGVPLDKKGLSTLRSLIGSIAYLALGSRLDIASAISCIAEGQAKGTENHISSCKKLLRYLRHTATRHLALRVQTIEVGSEVELSCQFDANFGADRARSGATFRINNQVTHWLSRRQKSIVLSTCESELTSCSVSAKELVGMKNFLEAIFGTGTKSNLRFSLTLWGDNRACNFIASCQASVRKVRHLTLSQLYVRELTQNGILKVVYVPTGENGGDVLTKVLGESMLSPLLPVLCLDSFPDPCPT